MYQVESLKVPINHNDEVSDQPGFFSLRWENVEKYKYVYT